MKLFSECPDNIADWIKEQKIFFVATAPKSPSGHINVSPKGHDTFTLASPNSCWYVDLTGSGNETISHLTEPGGSRSMTVMFVAFDGPPQIVRLWGKGRVLLLDSPEFNALLPVGDERRLPGTRAIIWVDFHALATSCGFSIPRYSIIDERDTLLKFMQRKEDNDANGKETEGMRAYWAMKNSLSVDDLPGPGQTIGVRYPSTPTFPKRIADIATLPSSSSPASSHPATLFVGICLGLGLATALSYARTLYAG